MPASELALLEEVRAAIQAWKRARPLLGQAADAFFSGRENKAERRLRAAYAIYPKDPEIAYNWALALARRGDWSGCFEAAADVSSTMPHGLRSQCLCTLGLALAMGGDDEGAARLLSIAIHDLEYSGPLTIDHLPVWAVWMTGSQVVGDGSDRFAIVVAALLARLQPRGLATPELRRLHAAYQQAIGRAEP